MKSESRRTFIGYHQRAAQERLVSLRNNYGNLSVYPSSLTIDGFLINSLSYATVLKITVHESRRPGPG